MRWFTIRRSLPLLFLALLFPGIGGGLRAEGLPEDNPALSRQERWEGSYRERWNRLIPRYAKLQFAGGMGVISAGVGWDYGRKRQWETDVLIGLLPRFSSANASATFTLKQNYIPWKLPVSGRWSVEPLATGLYVNKLTARNFWGREPEKYGGPYYRFATNMRVSVFLGQRVTYSFSNSRRRKSVTAFYEISSNDLYLVSAFTNRSLGLDDILVLSFGLKFQFL